ncbi:MAG: anaerobic glycerol-3-phosphate dehydrogenase subunit C [Bacteroidales bacterium]|nr:anaerobic glycerol-3-phosphate dehydrogenase subunit C [Bacteroidales bacterium]
MDIRYNISDHNFEQCLKCTICTVYCPVVQVNPDFPGPKQAGPDGERFRMKFPDMADTSLKYCMNCKRCEVACPSGVRIGDIIQTARIKDKKTHVKLRDAILANTDIVGTMATMAAPVVNSVIKLRPVKKLMDSVMKIDSRRTFPDYSQQTFEKWFRKYAMKTQSTYDRQVTYFHGCYVNYNYPQLGKDLVKIMNAAGYGVNLMEHEKCCGIALISNGLIKQAKWQAGKNMDGIRKSVLEDNRTVISTSSTCILTMRDEYPHLLGIDNKDVREQIDMATRFLYRLIDEKKITLIFRSDYKKRVAYHSPCHLDKLGWEIYSVGLLRMIEGVDLMILDSNCCGIGGSYGFKKENYDVSQKVGEPLFRQIEQVNPDFVATDCETCKWQIEMSTSARVKNPISVIAEALDVEATYKANLKNQR